VVLSQIGGAFVSAGIGRKYLANCVYYYASAATVTAWFEITATVTVFPPPSALMAAEFGSKTAE